MKSFWANVPIPEAYVGGLLAARLLHAVAGRPISRNAWFLRIAGLALVLAGLGLIAWAMAAVREIRIDQPARLVTHGPYARSRHPMYLAWALGSLGISLLANSRWLLTATLGGALYHHLVEIPKEEAVLIRRFGTEYRSYQERTRRYW